MGGVSAAGILTSILDTTIKVEQAVRDRLAAIARERGTTMRQLLETESRRLEAEQRWAAIERCLERIRRDDPAAWEDYLRELSEVTAGDLDTSAAEEWPE
jgi:hypothetical protein